jgi:tRNA-dihydrouridine synthase B
MMTPMTLYDDLPTSYQVGHLTISPNVTLAPMAGVTDSIFRRLVLGIGGCGLVSSEMTNAASVSPKAMQRHHLLDYLPEERPIAMQLSGNDPDLVASAAQTVERLGPDIIDINCGCPSPKVTGGGHGSALLRDLPKMSRLLKAVRAAVNLPTPPNWPRRPELRRSRYTHAPASRATRARPTGAGSPRSSAP